LCFFNSLGAISLLGFSEGLSLGLWLFNSFGVSRMQYLWFNKL